MLRLRWDFRTRFPEPLPEAVDAGVMAAEDTSPQSVEAIHREHGRRMLGALSDLDAVMDERRSGPPKLAHRIADSLTAPTRIERWYTSLLGVYEEWFGQEAAEAFDRAVRAWHAHIEVVVDRDIAPSSTTTAVTTIAQPPLLLESHNPPPTIVDPDLGNTTSALILAPHRLPTERRIIARLPVPKPLPNAVAAGHFGTNDRGKPINPSAEEVYAITVDHADRLIDLIRSLPASDAQGRSSIADQIKTGIAKYAEDFGPHAAQRLEAYCRRQARVRNHAPAPHGR